MVSQLHIRKVKENETGGKTTPNDEPFLLKMIAGSCGFEDSNGFNYFKQKETQSEIKLPPSKDFDQPQRIAEPKEINNDDPF